MASFTEDDLTIRIFNDCFNTIYKLLYIINSENEKERALRAAIDIIGDNLKSKVPGKNADGTPNQLVDEHYAALHYAALLVDEHYAAQLNYRAANIKSGSLQICIANWKMVRNGRHSK